MTVTTSRLQVSAGSFGNERRILNRSHAMHIGTIILSTGYAEKCMISNISVSGAEIIRYFADEISHNFQLQIANNLYVPAKIVWNKGLHYGVWFCI